MTSRKHERSRNKAINPPLEREMATAEQRSVDIGFSHDDTGTSRRDDAMLLPEKDGDSVTAPRPANDLDENRERDVHLKKIAAWLVRHLQEKDLLTVAQIKSSFL